LAAGGGIITNPERRCVEAAVSEGADFDPKPRSSGRNPHSISRLRAGPQKQTKQFSARRDNRLKQISGSLSPACSAGAGSGRAPSWTSGSCGGYRGDSGAGMLSLGSGGSGTRTARNPARWWPPRRPGDAGNARKAAREGGGLTAHQ